MSDVSSELGDLIAKSKVFGSSDNIRVGRYKFLIKRVFAEKVESGRFAFAELKVIESNANPQVLPPGVTARQFDEGGNPNRVGTDCAMKVNFDGPGAKSAGGNVKEFVLGLFGMTQGDTSDDDANRTWKDLSRQKDLHVGDAEAIDPATNRPILATKAKRANPGCGMVIACTASMKEKKKTKLLAPEQKEYITKLVWECVAKPGIGENSLEAIAKRRADIELASEEEVDEPAGIAAAPTAPLPPIAATSPLPPVPQAAFTPAPPWRPHPDQPLGNTPETRWYWDGNAGVKNEIMLRNGA